MTTTITLPDHRLSSPNLLTAARPQTRTSRNDVRAVPAAVRSEWIKLRSLRSTPAILGLSAVIGVLMSWILAMFVKTDPGTHIAFTTGQTFIFSTWLTAMLAIVMGTLSFTAELQHGTLANVITAQPARWVVVAAKAAVGSCFGLVMGVVGMLAGYAGAVLGGLGAGDASTVVPNALWGLVLTAIAPVFGLGVGMIIRHSAAATTTVLVWALVVENLVQSVAPTSVSRLMPFSAASRLLGIRSAGDTDATLAAAFPRVVDAALFLGYTGAAIAIGTALLARRDTA